MRANTVLNSLPRTATGSRASGGDELEPRREDGPQQDPDPVLCAHCGRTATNGLVCIGMCVADSGY